MAGPLSHTVPPRRRIAFAALAAFVLFVVLMLVLEAHGLPRRWIAAILLLNGIVGIVQERRATHAVAMLRARVRLLLDQGLMSTPPSMNQWLDPQFLPQG